ncbi:MAG: sigma-54-dependent Fis family transcriptional regulator [Phycisphaerales bacterium]|nr:sigma-54-dependent Fis family transcriptional regulator [Phycisphaerales bacterium]
MSTQPITTAQILIVEDEPEHADVMADALRRLGHVCTIVHDVASADEELTHGNFDVIITDLVMPGAGAEAGGQEAGLRVLELAKQKQPNAETIMVTAHGDVPTARAAFKFGAYDFIEKPLDLEVYRNLVNRAAETVALRQENISLQGKLDATGFEGIIGESQAIRSIIAAIKQVAPTNIPVLITGESGTGKELVARAVHRNSKRKEGRYVTLNAAGQSETLVEDELFGHVKGAFTGAEKNREGIFEYAGGGTLFLDEIGDMPVTMQAKLLRVLESGDVIRLGSNEVRHVDVRFITATNRNLLDMVKAGTFREDLYFRIKGTSIHVPPLRERREDIPPILNYAVARFAREQDANVKGITEPAMLRLLGYAWPGNVRELLNVVQNMVVMCDADMIDVRHVPQDIVWADKDDEVGASTAPGSLAGIGLDQLEKRAIRETLKLTSGNREQTAKLLGIGERTLYRKLKEYGLR